ISREVGRVALLDDIDEILIPEEVLQTRIRELGRTISTDYNGKEPLLVAILTGAVLFVSDLIRQVSIACQLDFMATSSYGVKTEIYGQEPGADDAPAVRHFTHGRPARVVR